PMCGGASSQPNRWSNVLEALTGTWSSYSCDRLERQGGVFNFAYDQGYFIPHINMSTGSAQANDGILDAYKSLAKFGLMTFDSIHTFLDAPPLVDASTFHARLHDNVTRLGDFSYGNPGRLFFPGCATGYMIDNGATNEDATIVRLISVGRDAITDMD